ncbi:hypothetical protein Ana3638_18615 [Anaerocolumna sedimenticola]|uniref:HTH cro/C1-type domain-containing protein n=1 Tax=Anaerocolumna sedimenticola TaxID=2696063 RepID=A0A6P1TSV5_9FIRM|nr:helix-turn-helix domain-containing protein [Anaerocolumna sedimenticola]QHQ62548.1 hypothetical protein Ana3638_18615 [Anaerocolumna sedimenticola]
MNAKIIQFFKNIIERKGIKYTFVAERSGIEYQRLMRIFHQNATISGSELICLSKVLEVEQSALMNLLDAAA